MFPQLGQLFTPGGGLGSRSPMLGSTAMMSPMAGASPFHLPVTGFGQPNQLAGVLQGGGQSSQMPAPAGLFQGGQGGGQLQALLAHLFGGGQQPGGLFQGSPQGSGSPMPTGGQPGAPMGPSQNPLMGLLSPQMLAGLPPQLAALFRGGGGGQPQQPWGMGFNNGPSSPPMGGGMYGGGQPFMSR